ncbi:glycoside hydrolase family 5 protein [Colletotrichum sojae]|uniref:Glycoside hydrolase family 5 protein n=1 Tax=Colletotrichum sojae TaxID=2175907 RepID=A0A8H6JCQ9_9PEZI|nr:glycoside hydrolase family 5 protein [Colletotrichum sojae]
MSPPLTTAANYAANDLSDAALGVPIALEDGFFVDGYGRALSLHGLNISGASKLPTTPNGLSHLTEGFFEHRTVTFVGRPFPLEDAPLHFRRLQAWGLPLVRLLVTWESIGHAGPDPRTDLDLEYIEYLRKLIEMMPAYGIKCFVCAHQDVWSRFSGGSGAPGWTFEVAGLDVEAFTETGAAYVHGQDELRRASAPVDEKEPSGPFVWPSGYQKLAASTMATLFWAGDALAPKLQCRRTGKDGKEEAVSVKEFLQDALIEAFGRLADEVAGLEACIGFEPMNEPHRGLINLHGFHGWNYDTDLHIGHYPSLKQALALASGYSQEIDYYVKSWPFPTRISHKSVVDPKGRSAWLSSKEKNHGLGECVWRAHGAWEWDETKKSANVLQENYFEVDHRPGREGKPIEWYRDFYAPFLKRFSERVSRKSSRQFCFIEPIPNEFMPPWVEKDSKEAAAAQKQRYATKTVIDSPRPNNLVFAPHFYDLNVLFSKHHSWMSVNVQGLSRGMFILKALYFGARALRKNYRLQISNILKYGKASLGSHVPSVIGEVGIPFDIEGGEAFATGRYDKQRELMHALISAMEDNQVNFTLWNYNPDNRVEYGDGWNREDFSVINSDEKEEPDRIMQDYANEAHAKDELFRGGRVLDVIIRPYAVKIAGRPLRSDWDPRTLRYEFEWTSQDRVGEKQSDKRRTTEVFIPRYHYADGIKVKLSDGDWSYDAELQTLYVRHKAEVYRHRLVVEIPNVGKRLLERVERRRRAVPPGFPLSLVSANTEVAIEELDKGLILVMLLLPAIAAALAIFAQSLHRLEIRYLHGDKNKAMDYSDAEDNRLFNPRISMPYRDIPRSQLVVYDPTKQITRLQMYIPGEGVVVDKGSCVVYISSACRNTGQPSAKASWAAYLGPGSRHSRSGPLHPDLPQTSSRAEIEALSRALDVVRAIRLRDQKLSAVKIATDSEFLVRAMAMWIEDGGVNSKGKRVAHFETLRQIHERLEEMTYGEEGGLDFCFWAISREENMEAEKIANRALDQQ